MKIKKIDISSIFPIIIKIIKLIFEDVNRLAKFIFCKLYISELTVFVNASIDSLKDKALKHNFNLMYHENGLVGISLDEKTDYNEVEVLANLFNTNNGSQNTYNIFKPNRTGDILTHPIFHSINSETDILILSSVIFLSELKIVLLIILFGLINFIISAEVIFKSIYNLINFIPEEFDIIEPPMIVINKKYKLKLLSFFTKVIPEFDKLLKTFIITFKPSKLLK